MPAAANPYLPLATNYHRYAVKPPRELVDAMDELFKGEARGATTAHAPCLCSRAHLVWPQGGTPP